MGPVQCVSYITAMTPPPLRYRLVSGDHLYFEYLKRSRKVVLTGYGGDFLENLLSTYCTNPAGKYFSMSPWSWGLAQD